MPSFCMMIKNHINQIDMKSLYLKELLLLIGIGIGLWWWQNENSLETKADTSQLQQQVSESFKSIKENLTKPPTNDVSRQQNIVSIEQAQRENLAKTQVIGEGKVIKILPDDNQGSRHQRFILQVPSGTILIVHNLELSSRLPDLQNGDTVSFAGEYIKNKHGGFVHWTHHDPSSHHEAGWLIYRGQKYQ